MVYPDTNANAALKPCLVHFHGNHIELIQNLAWAEGDGGERRQLGRVPKDKLASQHAENTQS